VTGISRRDVVKTIGAALALPTAGRAADLKLKPEPGAKLRMLRWKRFVQGDEDQWAANSKKFTETTGIEVRVDAVSFEDIRPKAAVAANVGSGPDILLGWIDDPHLYPDKLVDLTEVAEYLGSKYGGWFDMARKYGTRNGRWIGLPLGMGGALLNYRVSWMKQAGFETFPKDMAGYLKLCQALAKNGHPPGFALSHATGDSETWMHNILWSHGGKLADDKNRVVINSPETIAALEYLNQLSKTFIDGVFSWTGTSNNNAFLESKISLTSNGISIYYVAKHSENAAYKTVADDMDHHPMPVGPLGHPAELHLLTQAMVFKYTKYPNAAKEYLRFMWEKEQYEAWQKAAWSYMSPPLKAYIDTPFWKEDPKYAPFRDVAARMLWNGYAGELGQASAACMADWIVVDMFAQCASGQKTPKQAAADAAERAKRYYKA
jgi:multiple sugar transport system substrate-binding protein